jgi:rhodanese-related sulfurtransferase/rubrerythrin
MRWKQFFTRVRSIDADRAREMMEGISSKVIVALDVRQPKEYEAGHIPGAKLIPIPDLTKRLDELDREKGVIVYCAIGGRSRIAAQMLAGRGFSEVYNLAGGFKAWTGKAAFGTELEGLDLFSGKESPQETLVVAYSLEEGLRDFYLSIVPKVTHEDVKRLFEKLAAIELNHQERIFAEYVKVSGQEISRKAFADKVVVKAVEGGLTTEEYIELFQPDLGSVEDIVELAMSIEAQALDLYERASDRSSDPETKAALKQIAAEEQAHLRELGRLMDGV